jgi:hypothetical protein
VSSAVSIRIPLEHRVFFYDALSTILTRSAVQNDWR